MERCMRWSKPKPLAVILLCASAVLASGQPSVFPGPVCSQEEIHHGHGV